MSDEEQESGGYGIGVWAMGGGLIVAILSGLFLAQFDSLTLAVSSEANQAYLITLIAFGVGLVITVAGMVTAVAEHTLDYVMG